MTISTFGTPPRHYLDTHICLNSINGKWCVLFDLFCSENQCLFVCFGFNTNEWKLRNISNLLVCFFEISKCLCKIWPRWSFTIIRPPFLYVVCRCFNVGCWLFITKMESECAYVSIDVLKFEFWSNIFMS
jgi:hypothetical protein